eukprot:1742004-Pyramimonas_sp.AAC.3
MLETVPRGPSCPPRLMRQIDAPDQPDIAGAARAYYSGSKHARTTSGDIVGEFDMFARMPKRVRTVPPLAASRSREETAVWRKSSWTSTFRPRACHNNIISYYLG